MDAPYGALKNWDLSVLVLLKLLFPIYMWWYIGDLTLTALFFKTKGWVKHWIIDLCLKYPFKNNYIIYHFVMIFFQIIFCQKLQKILLKFYILYLYNFRNWQIITRKYKNRLKEWNSNIWSHFSKTLKWEVSQNHPCLSAFRYEFK